MTHRPNHLMAALGLASILGALGAGCSKKSNPPPPPPAPAPTGTQASFDLSDVGGAHYFFNFPWPSDLRLTSTGAPDFTNFVNPGHSSLFGGLLTITGQRAGFPAMPTAYFKFSDAITPPSIDTVIPADPSQTLLLIDVDPTSTELGKLFPIVASVPEVDAYVQANLLAISPRPGVVLRGKHTYAFVVRRSFNDAAGKSLGVPQALWDLENGRTPSASNGAQVQTNYSPLWAALKKINLASTDVAAATVFTTGDMVADLESISNALASRFTVTIQNVGIPTDGGAVHHGYPADGGGFQPGYCELDGEVASFPKFQQGDPPFDTQGTFALDSDGVPIQQGTYDHVPVAFTFPQGPMPQGGYPLVVYYHGSGGVSRELIDNGPGIQLPDGGWVNTPGEGPAYVLAPYGFAMVGPALPVNPQRLPGAQSTAYLNFNNLTSFRDTFRQGAIEQRMFLAALHDFQIQLSDNDLAACGITLPPGETALHYRSDQLYLQGHSMGGMYTNLIGALEPRVQAVLPTGAGGYWQYYLLHTDQVPWQVLLPGLLDTSANVTWQHPTLMVVEAAWEPIDPMEFVTRLSRRPLPGHSPRDIFEPVGLNDTYFDTEVYDAMALANGNREAGDQVWPTMQDALGLQGLGGIVSFPVTNELTSEDGTPYTGVVGEYADPTGWNGHYVFLQVPGLQHQYACFLSTRLNTGHGTVVAENPVGSPCE
jgi:hypothetical protein